MLVHNVPQNGVRPFPCLRTNFVYYSAERNNEASP
jgi:hypothetical protein